MMVKICGITNREDALAAVNGGAAALGFNFYPPSPRYLSVEKAAELTAILPAGICKVGIFVNEPARKVTEVMALAGLDVAQLHGQETPAEYPQGVRVWKGIRVDPSALRTWEQDPAEAVLLDGLASGQTFDWKLAAGSLKKVILAGGLDANNVRKAIEHARPWGVDACSRLESTPGKKDHFKMAEFLRTALAAL